MASAPAASAAFAISVISVTLGLSFIIIGCLAFSLTAAVISERHSAFCPRAMPPSFTLGQETLISSISTSVSARRSTTSRYSSIVFPHTLTMILVSYFFKKGISLSINTSIPGFCSPMELSMPPYTSATLGVGFPGQGILATPLVTTAPNWFKSTNSPYSMPDPKVPEAVITGFLNSTPAMVTFVFIFPPPWLQIRGRPCRYGHCSHANGRPHPLSCRHIPGRLPHRRPFVPPGKYRREYPLPGHTA